MISLLLVLVTALNAGGCGDSEYARAEVVKLGHHFSFEYPPSYEKLTPDAFQDNEREPSVTLLYINPDNMVGKADIQIYVILFSPIADRPDATAWTEEHISILELNDGNFQLYEQSTVDVDGVSGHKLVYFSTILGNYLNSPNLIIRDVYLDYRGYIWKLSVLAIEEMGDEAEHVFEHFIESFRFED